MKCLNCNFLVLGDKIIMQHEEEGHVVMTIDESYNFWLTANKLNLLTEEHRMRLLHGGPIPMGGN